MVNQITFILYILSIILVVHSRNIWEIVFFCKVPDLSSTSCWNSQIVVVVAGISIVFGQIRDGGRTKTNPKQQIAEPCSSRCYKDFLEDFDSSDAGNINSEDEMSEEEPQVLTNGLVCEFYNKFKDLTWNEVVIKFKGELCVSKADCEGQDLSVYTKIERTFKKWKSLRGKKAKKF